MFLSWIKKYGLHFQEEGSQITTPRLFPQYAFLQLKLFYFPKKPPLDQVQWVYHGEQLSEFPIC